MKRRNAIHSELSSSENAVQPQHDAGWCRKSQELSSSENAVQPQLTLASTDAGTKLSSSENAVQPQLLGLEPVNRF